MERKIKIFSFAAILMLAVSVIGCKHNVTNNTPETCSVTFGVDGTGGTLKAKVEGGSEINSGNTVEHGKTVIFTAEPSDNYEVDKWIITGSAFETGTGIGGSTTAKVKITATVNITVSFKLKNYTVTFSVDGAGGTLKATVDGSEINPGNTVKHGKTVTFTAVPTAGYKVKEWKLNGNAVNGTNPSYTHTITQAVNVTVSFEPGEAVLTLEAGKNTVKVRAKTADGKPIVVKGCNVETLANDTETTLTAKEAGTQITLQGTITELNCGLTQLTALNVSGCTALKELICYSNGELSTLDVQGCTALQKLNCRSSKITSLDVSSLTALKELICNDNKIPELNVQGLTKLQQLKCGGNQLTALDVQGLIALQKLDCSGNQLATLNVRGLTALQELSCTENQLTALNVQGCASLQKLDCSGSQDHRYLSELNVQGCSALKELICYQNKLNADAFIKIFNDLPIREASDGATAVLYKDRTAYEDNCTDFTQPESLKKAFENARDVKHWKMQKMNGYLEEDI